MSVTLKRNQAIDVLRGIAVLLVLVSHFTVIDWISDGSWIGVDLFFVLSGFLVTGLLFSEYKKHGDLKIGRFLIRRGFKIYPMLYLYVLVAWMYFKVLGKPFTMNQVLGDLFFLQNYLGSFMAHTWSLAVEEHFYFLMPAVLVLLMKLKANDPFSPMPKIWLGLAIICLILRVINNLNYEYTSLTHHYPTHLRIDAMMFGSVLAYLFHFNRAVFDEIGKRRVVLFVSAAFLTVPYIFPIESLMTNGFGLLLIYLGFGGVLVWVVANNVFSQPNAILRTIAFIGFHSYSIYLWHLAVRNVLNAVFGKLGLALPSSVGFLIYLVATIFVGVVISYIVDMQFLKMRDRYFPRRAKVGLD